MKDESPVEKDGAKLLTPELIEKILAAQRECTMIWNTQDGNSAGTMVTFVWHEGSFWIPELPNSRARYKAMKRNPNMCIVVSVMGTGLGRDRCISMRGKVTIHDDQATADRIAPLFQRKLSPKNAEERGKAMATGYGEMVWLEIKPERLITADFHEAMTGELDTASLDPQYVSFATGLPM